MQTRRAEVKTASENLPGVPPFHFQAECKLWGGPRWSLLGCCYLEAHMLFRLFLFTLKTLHMLAGVLELSLCDVAFKSFTSVVPP